MTKQQFLETMDEIKDLHTSDGFWTCNDIYQASNNNSRMVYQYDRLFNFQGRTFNIRNTKKLKKKLTRIAALELFEIISLENKWYLKY